jgi:hypothetical protein
VTPLDFILSLTSMLSMIRRLKTGIFGFVR